MKYISLDKLQEGKVYKAYSQDGDATGKLYYLKKGKLYNSKDKPDNGTYEAFVGCSWVPVKKKYIFLEMDALPKPKIIEDEKSKAQVVNNIMTLKPSIVFKWINGPLTHDTFVRLKGKQLHFCDKEGNYGAKVQVDKVSLSDAFEPVKTIPGPKVHKAFYGDLSFLTANQEPTMFLEKLRNLK